MRKFRSIRAVGGFGTALVLGAGAVVAQEPLPTDSAAIEAAVIARAEADGARHPEVGDGTRFEASDQPEKAGGTNARRCVQDGSTWQVRSGEFLIGGQYSASQARRVAKIWWIPLHGSNEMPPLIVEGRSLTDPEDTFTYTQPEIAWQYVGAEASRRRNFFATGFVAPRPGHYLLIATSGPNWGCFRHRVLP